MGGVQLVLKMEVGWFLRLPLISLSLMSTLVQHCTERITKEHGAGETDPAVKCWLLELEDPSSNPWNTQKKLDVVAPASDPSSGDMETGIPGAHWPANLAKSMSSGFSRRHCLKNIRQRVIEENTWLPVPPHTPAQTNTNTCISHAQKRTWIVVIWMSPIGFDIWTLGRQLVALFGEI